MHVLQLRCGKVYKPKGEAEDGREDHAMAVARLGHIAVSHDASECSDLDHLEGVRVGVMT